MTKDTANDDSVVERSGKNRVDGTTSRRRVLAASAVLSAGAAGVSPAVSAGDKHDRKGSEEEPPAEEIVDEPPEAVPDEFANDIEILNFARTLEFLEAEFYTRGLENIDAAEFQQEFEQFGVLGDVAVERLQVVRDHEITHAEVLGQTVELLGGEPVASPEFDFGTTVQNPAEFVATGALLEDVGVSAYAGAAPSIENADLVPPALSIHSVEARHASFLRELNGEIGFPMAFDQPRSRSEVLELASGFIVE